MKFMHKLKSVKKVALLGVAASLLVVGGIVFGGMQKANADITFSSATNCDNNAVVYCGGLSLSTIQNKYKNGDAHNSKASIQNIYAGNGITSADISAMSSNAVAGYVTKSGDVYAGSELVATNAWSVGRQTMPGSYYHNTNGTVWYSRPTSTSFVSSSLKAYVVMVNGKFSYAILASCGNPVKATPKLPNYTIQKDVRVKGTSTWQQSVNVNSGTHVEYRVTVKSTGAISASNITVRDVLPSNVQYVSGTLARNGSAFDSSASAFFGSGTTIAKLAPNATVTYTFEGVVSPKDTVYTCQPGTYNNVANMSSPGLPNKSDDASVSKTCAPKPVYSCDLLTPTPVSRTEFQFTTTATAKYGATITGYYYNFGDGKTVTVPSTTSPNVVNHNYTEAKQYNVSVAVIISVDGTTKQVSSQGCQTTVTVKPAPIAACIDLKALSTADRTRFTLVATANAQYGATIQGYDFSVKDSSGAVVASPSVNTPASTASTDVTVQKDGDYAASVAVRTSEGVKTSEGCTTTFKVTPAPQPGITIVKTVDGVKYEKVSIGQLFTYQVTVTNTGAVDLTNAVVTDTPPTGVTLVSADKGTISNNAWTYTIPSLKIGASASFNLKGQVPNYVEGDLVNKACVEAPQVNPEQPKCDTATVVVPPPTPKNPNITIVKYVGNDAKSLQVSVGANYAYRVVVTNNGKLDLQNVVVSDTPQAGITLLSNTDNLGSLANNTWTYTIPSLAAGDSVEFHFTAKVDSYVAGSLVNTACVNAPEINPDHPDENDACDTANVTVTPPETPPVLPDTGAGNVVGVFAAVVIGSALVYRSILSRKLGKN